MRAVDTSAISTVTSTSGTLSTTGSTTSTTTFKIRGYTATKTLGCLVPVESSRFQAADGHTWLILFFPNIARRPGIVAFQLRYACGNRRPPARATARFTLLPRGGGEPFSFARTFRPYFGEPMHYMTREKLDKYVTDDDSLTLRCDVSVVEKLDKYKRKKVTGASSGSPGRPRSRIKTAWLRFTRCLLAAPCTMPEEARPLLA